MLTTLVNPGCLPTCDTLKAYTRVDIHVRVRLARPDWLEEAEAFQRTNTRHDTTRATDRPTKGETRSRANRIRDTTAININTRGDLARPNVNSGPFSLPVNKCALQSPRYGNPSYAYPSTLPAPVSRLDVSPSPFPPPSFSPFPPPPLPGGVRW